MTKKTMTFYRQLKKRSVEKKMGSGSSTPEKQQQQQVTKAAPSIDTLATPPDFPQRKSVCDQIVYEVLSECDQRGGVPHWNKSRHDQPVSSRCQVPYQSLSRFNEYWDKRLEGCELFHRQGDQLELKPPFTEKTKEASHILANIQDLQEKIHREMLAKGDNVNDALKSVVDFLNKDYEGVAVKYILQRLNQSDIAVRYQWKTIPELQRLQDQMEYLLQLLQAIKI